MTKKLGRNDPCPCGSGKKYKKCCEERLGPKRHFQASVLSSRGGVEAKASQISTNFFSQRTVKLSDPIDEPRKAEEDAPHHPPEADKPM